MDGSVLSAPIDPHATLVIPEPRQTEPPPTEVLKLEETKQEIPPTIASPQQKQKPEELASTITAPAPAFESSQIKDLPALPIRKSSLSPSIMIGVGALLVIGLIFFIFVNRANNATENSNRANAATTPTARPTATSSNSDQTSNAATPTPSPIAVTNLEGTNWEFIRNGSYKESFEFKTNGKVTRRFESDVRNGKWTRQGNRVSIFIEGNGIYYGFAIEGVIQGEGMRGQYIFGKQENQSFLARRIQ
jgi:hypothetical protein